MTEQEIIEQLTSLTHENLLEGMRRVQSEMNTLKTTLETSNELVSSIPAVGEQDKRRISALLAARTPHPTVFTFISKNIAEALAMSQHHYLKETGQDCVAYFNNTSESKYVQPVTGQFFVHCIDPVNGYFNYNFYSY